MSLSLSRALEATSGHAQHAGRFPNELRIVTDTRDLHSGDTFLALRGERFDGDAFAAEALRRGAAALILDRVHPELQEIPILYVADTKTAYLQLAASARGAYAGRVIAITGSTGKTTTRFLLEQLLAVEYGSERVLGPPGNENNELGVSKVLLRALQSHRVIVVEMGARHLGEIAELVDIALPDTGILTNIGEAHLEVFGSREAIAQTKWGLFSRGAQAVLNARDSESRSRSAGLDRAPLWFGEGPPALPGVWLQAANRLALTHLQPAQEYAVHTPFPGAHNRSNLAAAIAGALLLDVPVDRIVAALPRLRLPEGRYESIALNGYPRIIYDAYNANESGTVAALEAFADESGDRRIAVLAGMAELGPQAAAMHERVGAHAAANIDFLLVGGEYADAMENGARRAGLARERIVSFTGNAEAAQWIRANASRDDVVLLKGSRKYRMEQIVEELRR